MTETRCWAEGPFYPRKNRENKERAGERFAPGLFLTTDSALLPLYHREGGSDLAAVFRRFLSRSAVAGGIGRLYQVVEDPIQVVTFLALPKFGKVCFKHFLIVGGRGLFSFSIPYYLLSRIIGDLEGKSNI